MFRKKVISSVCALSLSMAMAAWGQSGGAGPSIPGPVNGPAPMNPAFGARAPGDTATGNESPMANVAQNAMYGAVAGGAAGGLFGLYLLFTKKKKGV